MSFIHVLDENTINQIAAGEVVERPSAVVKELVENAMDAKATAVTVEIKDGGLSFVRITDNGSGIAKEDIPLAFLRHATSKIYNAEDLLSVTSLGFRGEALSSIAAVAQVELITKTPSSLNGYRYIIEGGVEKSIEEIGCPSGTTIIVRNIFYNTPARRKFLKSSVTEAGYIGDLMERILVSHPDIAFKFIVNTQTKLQSSGNNNSKDILYNIYGRDLSRELLQVNYSDDKVKINGFIGKPSVNRSNRGFENYFINGRYIKSNIITKAIEEAYKPFLMQHKYPFTSIYLELEPSLIDVNVHPQKMELRLRNGEELYQLLYNLIRNTLSGKDLIPKVRLSDPNGNKVESAAKSETIIMPEPFEENRRKKFEEQTGEADLHHTNSNISKPNFSLSDRRYAEYGKSQAPYHKVADKNADYITATRPLIQSDIPITGVINNTVGQSNSNVPGEIQALSEGKQTLSEISQSLPGGNQALPNEKQKPLEENQSLTDENRALTEGMNVTANINSSNEEKPVEAFKGEQMNLFNVETSTDDAPFLSPKALEEHKLIGQLFATYWLVEYKKELYIIDQHAAHEKVLYERLMTASKSKTYDSQQLLPPIVLTLTLREQEVLIKHGDILNSIGYEFEHFGGNEYSIRAVPADLYSISEKALLLEFIDELAEEGTGSFNSSVSILEKAASLSCKAAVKANHTMSYEEASALIKELLTLDNPYNCPHGRPVIISMSQYELERKFKRVL